MIETRNLMVYSVIGSLALTVYAVPPPIDWILRLLVLYFASFLVFTVSPSPRRTVTLFWGLFSLKKIRAFIVLTPWMLESYTPTIVRAFGISDVLDPASQVLLWLVIILDILFADFVALYSGWKTVEKWKVRERIGYL